MTDDDATSVLATLNRHGRNARDALDELGCAARDHFGRILSTALLTGGGLWLLWSTRPVTAALVEEARHLTPEGQVNALLMVLSIWWVWRRLRSSVRLRVQASAVAVAVPAASGISHRGGAAKTPDETLERRARHEAAHVVVGRHLGAILYRSDLTVRDGDGSGGRTVMHWPEGLPPQDEMWNDAVMSLSGNEVDIAGGFSRPWWLRSTRCWRVRASPTKTSQKPPTESLLTDVDHGGTT